MGTPACPAAFDKILCLHLTGIVAYGDVSVNRRQGTVDFKVKFTQERSFSLAFLATLWYDYGVRFYYILWLPWGVAPISCGVLSACKAIGGEQLISAVCYLWQT